MDDGNVTCHSCEREIDDSLTWCPGCGATLSPEPPVSDSARIAAELGSGSPEGWAAPEPGRAPPASGDPFASLPPGLSSGPTRHTPPGGNRAATMVIALVVLALVGAGAGLLFYLRSGPDEATAGDKEAAGLQPGDCWNDVPGEQTEVLEVPAVPCDQPHDNEVFAVVEVPGAPGAAHPGMETLDLIGGEMCRERFAGYTGEAYELSSLDIWMLYPTPSSWQAGDREVICSLYRMDLQKMTGSARAAP